MHRRPDRASAPALSAACTGALSIAALLCLGLGCAEPASQRSLVLIVVDTLRADRLGNPAHVNPTSPALDRWIASGRRYQRCFATSPWTLPSFASLFSGRAPSRVVDLEAKGLSGLDPETPLLAEILREHGFATGAVMNNAFLSPKLGFSRGFDTYDWRAGSNLEIRRADTIVDRALAFIDEHRERPFFLVVHLFDPHMAYDAPPPDRGRFSSRFASRLSLPLVQVQKLRSGEIELEQEDRLFISAAYDEEVAYVDRQLDRLFSGFAARRLLLQGLVVLTSDHGEELFEHGHFEHGHALWQELLHVPLIFWGSDVAPGADTSPVSLSDLMPTLLDALGIAAPEQLEGRSLLRSLRGEAVPERAPLYAEGLLYRNEAKAVVDWPHKLILDLASGERSLFDLERDPAERGELSALRPELAARLERTLRDHAAAAGPDPKRAPVTLDADTRERLRSLGYLE